MGNEKSKAKVHTNLETCEFILPMTCHFVTQDGLVNMLNQSVILGHMSIKRRRERGDWR